MPEFHAPKGFPQSSGVPRCGWADGARTACVVVFVFAGFTAVASAALLVYTTRHPALDFIQSPGGLVLRTLLFGTMACAAVLLLFRIPWRGDDTPVAEAVPATHSRPWWMAGALIAVILAIFVSRLGAYPFAAPDEVHHLVVAKNLAVHGAYASGHPASGLKYFDSFDSVGPVVLGPIALIFTVTGPSLVAARFVMVLFFAGLCAALFGFAHRRFGPVSGLVTIVLLLGTYSSIYLGRTLYGEVPALMFLVLSMVAWGCALEASGRAAIAWGLLAGLLAGCTLLAKTIFILAAFSALGAWLYDRATRRTVRAVHVIAPVAGALVPLGLWSLFQALHAPESSEEGGVFAIYQHYLLFGVEGFPQAFANGMMRHPLAHLGWLVVVLGTVPVLFRQRHDLPALVLYLYALFTIYWWLFFTPGQLHRYLWCAYGILAIFTAPWVCWAVRRLVDRPVDWPRRAAALVLCVVLVASGLRWGALQLRELALREEMSSEHALADAVGGLPVAARIATDIGRAPGVLNFLADRPARLRGADEDLFAGADAVVTLPARADQAPAGWEMQPAGDFVLLSRVQSTE